MQRSIRILTLFAVFVFSVGVALSAALLTDGSSSAANNPPSTLLGTVAVDPTDDPASPAKSPVWALAEANGRYYIGGNFTEVGGETQAYLAAIEVATGRLDPAFRPVLTNATGVAEVLALALSPDGNDLYIGGRFKNIDGTFRNRLAKLDAHTGAVDPAFNPNASAAVETIVVDDSGVYVGGAFTTIGGGTSPHLAKLDATTGALDPSFTATADGTVLDLEFLGSDLFVGGNFQTINGASHPHLVRLSTATGAVSANWATDFAVPHRVLALSVKPDGSMVYVGTAGTPSQLGNTVWGYTTAGIRTWQKVSAGDIQAIEATDSTVYVGTHGQWVYTEARYVLDSTIADINDPVIEPTKRNPNFPLGTGYIEDPSNTNATLREKFYSLDTANGDLLAWDPHGNSVNGVWELDVGPSGLLAGGDFTKIVNPTGVAGTNDTIFTPHFAVFPNIGSLDAAPEPIFTVDCAGTSCNVDGTASTDDVSIASYAWDFGNGQTATGAAATTTLANNTTHTVSLTVTDGAGNTATRQEKVIVGNGGLAVTHVATNSLNASTNLFQQQLPTIAQAGDTALAFLTVNGDTVAATAPAGWVFVGDETDNNVRTYIWRRTLTGGDPGTNVAFEISPGFKGDLTISVFNGVDELNPIAAIDSIAETDERVGHRAPPLSFAGEATVLHYWSDRSGETSEYTAPGSDATLSTSIGVGGGHISTVLSVATPSVTASAPQAVAVAEHHGDNALGWSIALSAAGTAVDTTPPVVTFATATTQLPGAVNLDGGVTDDISGVDRVRVFVRNQQTGEYWNGTAWVSSWSWNLATLNGDDTWTLPSVDLSTVGSYQVLLWAWDNNNNRAAPPVTPPATITVQ